MSRMLVTGLGLGSWAIGQMLVADGEVIGVITGIESTDGEQQHIDLGPIPERFTVHGSFTAHFVTDGILADPGRARLRPAAPRWMIAHPYLKKKKGRS